MDDIERTVDAYESDADAFVEKYLGGSAAAAHGDAFFDALDGDRVLDVGCGPGPDTATFAAEGYDAVGLDVTAAFLDAARERVPDAAFLRGDMRRLPVADRAVDGLWSCASFLHVPREDAVPTLREFRRVLRPGGVAFLSVKRRPFETDDDGRHFEYYDPEEVRALLSEADLEVLSLEADDRWVGALAERP